MRINHYRGKTACHIDSPWLMLTLYTPWMSRGRDNIELGFLVRWRRRSPYRWQWLKVWAGWTNPKLRDARGRQIVLEVETHQTNRKQERITHKSFVRFKAAIGAPKGA